ncbi:Mitochondrial transcription termination factor, mTERF [Handroanthus impetiginosus]|uniref:Mitochondrial transcription termination factor, mTERF n=1 Tax=Handroanthus impetiginosus TaxID=429701 RepID=A0A2G9FY68_9LAMI|nr:Mitochondrial transcription termination factor, mTERF [Handroanthus impetiginosus]
MWAIFCRRLRVSPKVSIFISAPQFFAPQIAVFIKSFSSKISSSDVNGDDPTQSFTISYLINSCGLSSKDAISISKKVTIKSPENPDSVLELLREYGFTNANIPKLITRFPNVLFSCPKKTLLPKLEFFRSIGVPLDVLARNLSTYPTILWRSLENYLIPSYDYLKALFKSDERAVNVFKRSPRVLACGSPWVPSSNVAILREQGIPESSIASLMEYQPWLMVIGRENLASYINRAAEMGFDRSKVAFAQAIQVFAQMSESTLKHKMEVYRRCGWSESEVSLAFLKFPLCMKYSEKKIMDNMDFLVNDLGLQPDAIARLPTLLGLNLDGRMKPRYLVARILKEKGLLTGRITVSSFLIMSEEKFLKRYVVNYGEDVPELLDIYRGKLRVSEKGFSRQVIFK